MIQKYKAKPTEIDGLKFPSKMEANYYYQLKLRMMAHEIIGFCRQPRFSLGAGVEYVADFIVFYKDGAEVVEVKGYETDVWKVKRKFFTEKYPQLKLTVVKK